MLMLATNSSVATAELAFSFNLLFKSLQSLDQKSSLFSSHTNARCPQEKRRMQGLVEFSCLLWVKILLAPCASTSWNCNNQKNICRSPLVLVSLKILTILYLLKLALSEKRSQAAIGPPCSSGTVDMSTCDCSLFANSDTTSTHKVPCTSPSSSERTRARARIDSADSE